MSSRKHYVALAAAIKRARVVPGYVPGDPPEVQKAVDKIVDSAADIFRQDNPRFDREKFLKACALP